MYFTQTDRRQAENKPPVASSAYRFAVGDLYS